MSLNKANSWFKFSIRFNEYSKRFFQKPLVWFTSFWVYFYLISRAVNCVSMSKMAGLFLQISWTQCVKNLIFCLSRGNSSFFSQLLFLCILKWNIYHSFDKKKIGWRLTSPFSKRFSLCSKDYFFYCGH